LRAYLRGLAPEGAPGLAHGSDRLIA
jgi:hypothetical protein